MDVLAEFLLKYRSFVFEKGHFAFDTTWQTRLGVLIMGAAALAAIYTYTRVRVQGTPTDRFVLGGVRALILLLLVFVLLRPVLLVATAIAQRNVVGVLIDDSGSMQVADMDGQPRATIVRSLLGGADSSLYRELSKKFVVQLFRVGNGGSRITSLGELDFEGKRTHLAPALEGVRQDLTGVPLAGLVLVSDGADNAPTTLGEALHSLSARKVPVFTVGVGRERFSKDIEVSRVETPRTVLKDAALAMNVSITQRGFGGHTMQLLVEERGRIVSAEPVILPRDGEAATVRIRVPTTTPGAHLFTIRIAPQEGELVTQNNAQQVLVTVQGRKEKILYVEGEPRFELKFLRQAVETDENLQLATLVRTAKDKFLRLGIDDSLELLTGFPKTREELFAYRGIILGSIEASFFSLEQLRMISDFVSERGGGLLMLGGRTSFAEGGYAGTPVADALPVELGAGREGKPTFQEVKVNVTPTGSLYAATQIAESETASAKRWTTLPVVTSVNQVTRIKPGATTLLAGAAPKGNGQQTVAMAYQRYGRGKAIAFPIQDSWLWQMRADTPLDDFTHRSLWRQLLRWLVSDVPGRVTVTPATDQVDTDEPVRINAEVVDQKYAKVNSAAVTAIVSTPSGSAVTMPLEWSMTRDGEYHMTYLPKERGVYRVQVTAQTATGTIASDPAFITVGPSRTEHFGAELRASLLQRIAEETGGRYYTPATAAALANDMLYSGSGNTLMDKLDLWDMPLIFILLLMLIGAEWGYRRMRGLV